MKKQTIFLFTAFCISLLSNCNSKPSTSEETKDGEATTELNENPDEIVSNSKVKVSFEFNGNTFENNVSRPNELKGIPGDGTNWMITFDCVVVGDANKQGALQFILKDFTLDQGVKEIKISTLNLMGFEDLETVDAIISSRDAFFEITSIEKIKSESAMGTTMEEYSVNGNFHGEFKNITGTKTFKVENGSFQNYILVDFKRN